MRAALVLVFVAACSEPAPPCQVVSDEVAIADQTLLYNGDRDITFRALPQNQVLALWPSWHSALPDAGSPDGSLADGGAKPTNVTLWTAEIATVDLLFAGVTRRSIPISTGEGRLEILGDAVAVITTAQSAVAGTDGKVHQRTVLRYEIDREDAPGALLEIADSACVDCDLQFTTHTIGDRLLVFYFSTGSNTFTPSRYVAMDATGAILSSGMSAGTPVDTPQESALAFEDKGWFLTDQDLKPLCPPLPKLSTADWSLTNQLVTGGDDSEDIVMRRYTFAGALVWESDRISLGILHQVAASTTTTAILTSDVNEERNYFSLIDKTGHKVGGDIELRSGPGLLVEITSHEFGWVNIEEDFPPHLRVETIRCAF